MERVEFIDPLAGEERPPVSQRKKLRPVPVPPGKPLKATIAVPSRGREREVQQLIHDLAVLPAENRPSL
jgi:hypothetical protein